MDTPWVYLFVWFDPVVELLKQNEKNIYSWQENSIGAVEEKGKTEAHVS